MNNKPKITLPSYFKFFKILMLLPGIALIIYLLSIILRSQDPNISQVAMAKYVVIRDYIYLIYIPLFPAVFLVFIFTFIKDKQRGLVVGMHELWIFWGFILVIFSYFIANQLSHLIRNFLY